MPTQVTAQDGDCLCGLAMNAGFLDCAPLRALGENSGLLARPLVAGDVVTIPDIAPEEMNKAVDKLHKFKKKNSPPVSIRFVHGSPNVPYLQDTETTVLHVSNYIVDQAGTTGQTPLPTGFGFNPDGHADPDTFKVEVVDPLASGTVNIRLEAMRPQYAANPATPGRFLVTGHAPFATADAAHRRIDPLECQQVSSGHVAFRTRYLKLVVDDLVAGAPAGDKGQLPNQALLVTDLADGNGTGQPGDNDTMEILDQEVRATYIINRCPGNPKCRVFKQIPIGGAQRQRFRTAFHIFRTTAGGAALVGGITQANVRRRVFKWLRRVYAQADMAPTLELIENLDPPPPDDMLVISQDHGGAARAGSSLSFNMTVGANPPVPFNLALNANETPIAVANRIVTSLPAPFTGQAFQNTRSTAAANPSADVIISHPAGAVSITGAQTNPLVTRLTVQVNQVSTNLLAEDPSDGSVSFSTPEMRRVLRTGTRANNRLDFYVIENFVSATLLGQAMMLATDVGVNFRPPDDLKLAVLIKGNSAAVAAGAPAGPGLPSPRNAHPVMDGSDTFYQTAAHEAGHVMIDTIHAEGPNPRQRTELMLAVAARNNAFNGPKRLCDNPVAIRYQRWTAANNQQQFAISAVQRLRTKAAPVMEAW